jgi:hypothetical protein
MALSITQIHKGAPEALNEEWFVLENPGDKVFNSAGCDVTISHAPPGKKAPAARKVVFSFKPGFVLKPKEKLRIVTGSPVKKTHGDPPSDDLENYHLHLGGPVIKGPGDVVRVVRHQLELAVGEFQPDQPSGLAPKVA